MELFQHSMSNFKENHNTDNIINSDKNFLLYFSKKISILSPPLHIKCLRFWDHTPLKFPTRTYGVNMDIFQNHALHKSIASTRLIEKLLC